VLGSENLFSESSRARGTKLQIGSGGGGGGDGFGNFGGGQGPQQYGGNSGGGRQPYGCASSTIVSHLSGFDGVFGGSEALLLVAPPWASV
jgi:hypothetical protein